MRPIIHSQKHYVQLSRSTAGANAEIPMVIVDSVESTVANTVFEVTEGATVKAVYIELWALGDGNAGSSIVILSKCPSNLAEATFTQMAALGTWTNKKNVLFTHQGLAQNDGVTGPTLIMRGWYKIPKSKQRFGLGDRLVLQMASQTPSTDTIDYCGFATYKEYS